MVPLYSPSIAATVQGLHDCPPPTPIPTGKRRHAGQRQPKQDSMKPRNLLFIMSDEHNQRVLGCDGHPMIRTPNLDRLAARGVRFTDAYCNSPICVPSRASFQTGRYVHEIRFWDNAIAYDGSVPSWGHRLQRGGPSRRLDRQAALPQRRGRQRLHARSTCRCTSSTASATRSGMLRDPLPRAQGRPQARRRRGPRQLHLPGLRRPHHRGSRGLAARARRQKAEQAVGAVRLARLPALPADRAAGMVRPLSRGQGALAADCTPRTSARRTPTSRRCASA